jgi:hypothetical protein
VLISRIAAVSLVWVLVLTKRKERKMMLQELTTRQVGFACTDAGFDIDQRGLEIRHGKRILLHIVA